VQEYRARMRSRDTLVGWNRNNGSDRVDVYSNKMSVPAARWTLDELLQALLDLAEQ